MAAFRLPMMSPQNAARRSSGSLGRVTRGGCPPRVPTDPDLHVKCIRLVILLRYAAQQAVNHSGARKTVSLLHSKELGPRYWAASASPRQLASPNPSRSLPKFLEAGEVTNDPVIPVVTSQFLRELLVLLPDRKMQIDSAPFLQR